MSAGIASVVEGDVRIGRGAAHGHHGELLQGVFDVAGRLRRGLVTLPCPMFVARAEVRLSPWSGQLTVTPAWKTKALAAAVETLAALGRPELGGRLTLDSDIEVGRGFGSSTGDVTAAIRAVLDALGRRLPPESVARIAVSAETAADPLMFDRVVLFAQRDGEVLEAFHTGVCPLDIVGVALRESEVDTLTLPPARYNAWEIGCFRVLRDGLRRALGLGDVPGIGRVATASALINQRFLPTPLLADLLSVATACRAAGVHVAHSGNIGGLLFDPAESEVDRKVSLARRLLARRGCPGSWHYRIRNEDIAEGVRPRA